MTKKTWPTFARRFWKFDSILYGKQDFGYLYDREKRGSKAKVLQITLQLYHTVPLCTQLIIKTYGYFNVIKSFQLQISAAVRKQVLQPVLATTEAPTWPAELVREQVPFHTTFFVKYYTLAFS